MWLILLAISITAVAGAPVANRDCPLDKRDVCRVEFSNSLPGSEAELDLFCNQTKHYMRCSIRVERRCRSRPETIQAARKTLRLTNRVCDKRTQLYKDIVGKLECFKGLIEDDIAYSCVKPQPDDEDLVYQELMKLGTISYYCAGRVYVLACLTEKMESACGEFAKNIFTEIVVKATALFKGCVDSVLKLLPAAAIVVKRVETKAAEREATTEIFDVCKVPINQTCIRDEIAVDLSQGLEEKECRTEIDLIKCNILLEEKCRFNPERLPFLAEGLKLTRRACAKYCSHNKAQEAMNRNKAQEVMDGNKAQETMDGNKAQETTNGNKVQETMESDRAMELKEVTKPLPCIYPYSRVVASKCAQWYGGDTYTENFVKLLSSVGITEVDSDEEVAESCLIRLSQLSCMPVNFGLVCGEDARDAIVGMTRIIEFPSISCKPEIQAKFPNIIRAMERELLQDEEVKNAIKK